MTGAQLSARLRLDILKQISLNLLLIVQFFDLSRITPPQYSSMDRALGAAPAIGGSWSKLQPALTPWM